MLRRNIMQHQLHGFSIITQLVVQEYHNDDDDTPSHFMIQTRQQVWSTAELPNLSETSMAGRLWGRLQRARSVEAWALAKPETAPIEPNFLTNLETKQDQTGGLIASFTLNALRNLANYRPSGEHFETEILYWPLFSWFEWFDTF